MYYTIIDNAFVATNIEVIRLVSGEYFFEPPSGIEIVIADGKSYTINRETTVDSDKDNPPIVVLFDKIINEIASGKTTIDIRGW